MHRAVSEFCEWMRMTNYAERTAETRQVYLTWFSAWLEERGITRPADVTKPLLERYQRSLYHHRKTDGRPLSFGFQYAQLVALRTFFRWAARTNRILYNPASELELPRLEHRLPQHVLSAPEVETVLQTADVAGNPLGLRDRAIMEVLYSTGMRRMELISLHLVDLDGERGTIRIRQGKGHKDRMVPVGERAVAWCDRYLAEVRPSYVVEPDEGTLFLSAEGGAFTPNRMSALVRGYVDRAQLGKRGSCHLFRHSCATLMLEGGADIRYIQQLLGHADLSTTQIYTQVSIRRLQQVHAATHPSAVLARRRPVAELDGEAGESDVEQLLLTLAAEAAEEGGEELQRTSVPEVQRVRSPQMARTDEQAWGQGRPETMRREAVR